MISEIFTVCDSAENYNGKLVIVGTFDVLGGNSFPLDFRPFALALRLRFSSKEFGDHQILLKMIDEEGTVLNKIEGQISIASPDPSVHYATFSQVFNFGPTKFNSPGRYSFELYIDGEWISGLPLNVVRAENGSLKAA